jgi:hypothetical protein
MAQAVTDPSSTFWRCAVNTGARHQPPARARLADVPALARPGDAQLRHVIRGCRAFIEFRAKPARAMTRTTACAMVVSADGYTPSTSMRSQ